MSYWIEISEGAEEDLQEAFAYYEQQKEGLGFEFGNHIKQSIQSIRSNPLKSQVRYKSTRVFFLKKFPFGIHFTVEQHTVLIIAVFHTSRSSKLWMTR